MLPDPLPLSSSIDVHGNQLSLILDRGYQLAETQAYRRVTSIACLSANLEGKGTANRFLPYLFTDIETRLGMGNDTNQNDEHNQYQNMVCFHRIKLCTNFAMAHLVLLLRNELKLEKFAVKL